MTTTQQCAVVPNLRHLVLVEKWELAIGMLTLLLIPMISTGESSVQTTCINSPVFTGLYVDVDYIICVSSTVYIILTREPRGVCITLETFACFY